MHNLHMLASATVISCGCEAVDPAFNSNRRFCRHQGDSTDAEHSSKSKAV